MNILILGDIFGKPGVKIIKNKLPDIIREKKIDFVIANGENAADNGLGITKKIPRFFLTLELTLSPLGTIFGIKKKHSIL